MTELDRRLEGVVLGPAMQRINPKQRLFAFLYGSGLCESAAAAAKEAGYGVPYTQSAWQLRQKPDVVAAIEETTRLYFKSLVPDVVRATENVIRDPKHKHHVSMLISLLGRMGYSEKSQVDVNVEVKVEDHTRAAVEDLRRLKALGASHEKLIEIFGESGLHRYERLLAGEPKLIEHEPAAPGSVDEAKRAISD